MSAPSLASAMRSRASVASVAATARVPRTARGVTTVALTVVVALGLLLPIGAVLQIVLMAQVDDRTRTQAIVVLDTGRVWGNPGQVLQARLAHAADLYRAGVAPVVVLTGPERVVLQGRADLIAYGVPAEDIVGFTTGADTVGALQIIAGVMRDLGWSAATVVTDPAHAARAHATATALGIDAHLSPTAEGTGTALTSEYVGKETVALLRFHLMTRWSLVPIVPQA
ncbi:MAG: YdcF family protein [Actinomycetota bacterium]|nr:YdcF family protein [Actinomycetota bacterium]